MKKYTTGEMGPFYKGSNNYINNWYSDFSSFLNASYPWFKRGGLFSAGIYSGQFNFNRDTGGVNVNCGFRLVLSL